MIGKKIEPELFRPHLENFIDMNHELVLLSKAIERQRQIRDRRSKNSHSIGAEKE